MCFMAESHPAEGYLRQVGKAVSTDGVHWTVVVNDIAALQAVDENKGTYGLALAVDPNLGTLQMWRAVGDGAGALTIRYAREE